MSVRIRLCSALVIWFGMLGTASAGSDPSLLLHLAFDEAGGTVAADGSGNGRNGQLLNGPTWVAGQVGGAVHLDGTDDYIEVAGMPGLTDALTFAVWVKADAAQDRSIPDGAVDTAGIVSIPLYLYVRVVDARGTRVEAGVLRRNNR